MNLNDEDESEHKQICFACVGEEFLSAEIKKDGTSSKCSYCNETQESITLEDLADRIEVAFGQHYRRTSTEPSSLDIIMLKEGIDWDREGDQAVWAIANAASIDEVPASDVQNILEERHADFDSAVVGEETEFDSESHYIEIGPNDIELRKEWRGFEHSLKTETRFFNKYAQATLGAVFEGLADHETRDGRRVVVEAGPGKELSTLYRARVFQASESLKEALERPDIGIGPPPYDAATAGRMNARGISVFYGATDPTVALAEIRAPVGSRVVVGKFELVRAVRLLDVQALESVFVRGSIFDGGFIGRLERAKFLERLSHRITMPVMPNDEPSDYLVTQAIADYLATEVKLDGIVYPSAQAGAGKRNVVLFHGAARVKKMELPPDTEISASLSQDTEDGPEIDYWVWEAVPPPRRQDEKFSSGFPPDFGLILSRTPDRDGDTSGVTLKLGVASITVHHIASVTFTTDKHSVKRHRSDKGSVKF